jgi:hypothetical protein
MRIILPESARVHMTQPCRVFHLPLKFRLTLNANKRPISIYIFPTFLRRRTRSEPSRFQERFNLGFEMPLDNHNAIQSIDCDISVLPLQPRLQLVPQLLQIARDLAHRGEMKIAATLIIGIDRQIFRLGAADMVQRRGEGDLGLCGGREGHGVGFVGNLLRGVGLERLGLGGRDVRGAQWVWGARLRAVGLGHGFDGGQVCGALAGGCGGGDGAVVADGWAREEGPGGGEGAQERPEGLYPRHDDRMWCAEC